MRILLGVIGMIFSGTNVRHCTRCVTLWPWRAKAVKMPLTSAAVPGSNLRRSLPAAPDGGGTAACVHPVRVHA